MLLSALCLNFSQETVLCHPHIENIERELHEFGHSQADKKLLAPKAGFWGGFRERGIGGSKCGATGVVALVYTVNRQRKLLTANVGDSRALLIQGGEAEQLTTDHVPDM